MGPICAHASHAALGTVVASVEDLSLHGLALVIDGQAGGSELVHAGDRLDRLTLSSADGLVYEGAAVVRHVGERTGALIAGLELEGPGIDLAALHRRGARSSFSERWEETHHAAQHARVRPDFKRWVAELRTYLEVTRDFLCAEENSIRAEDSLTRDEALAEYLHAAAPAFVARMNHASESLARLVGGFGEDEHAEHRAYCRAHLAPLLASSPFMRRAYEKPLGYAGDFEMMNMLYREHAEGEGMFGKLLNLYATQEIAARANINRISYLVEKIRAAIRATRGRRLRVASIGCGPAREIMSLLEEQPVLGGALDVMLLDQEERTIAHCERTLVPLAKRTGARIQLIRESIRRLLTGHRLSSALGEQDLIYSAGLFDYLNERSFRSLLSSLHGALVKGGLLVVGNVAAHNPSRHAMEYFSDWFLIHRSEAELREMTSHLLPTPAGYRVEAEPLGVNLFLVVHR